MKLPLTPNRAAAAVVNVVHKTVDGHLADLRRMPRSMIYTGPLRAVYKYKPDPEVAERTDDSPVLLVPPLAAPSLCFDLRRGCSLVEYLTSTGRSTYLVDYGNISFADRKMGIEFWVETVIPEAVRAVSGDAGGKPVHIITWSLGGIMSLLAAADHPQLPIKSLVPIGSPFDKYLTKPVAILANLNDRDFLAQLEAVDHFTNNMIAYPGRTFGQLYHHFLRANDLAAGGVDLAGHRIEMSAVKQPVLVIAGRTDGIAPQPAVHHLVDLLTGSQSVRYEVCTGGHLGVVTGRAARTTTWPLIDDWLDEQDGPAA